MSQVGRFMESEFYLEALFRRMNRNSSLLHGATGRLLGVCRIPGAHHSSEELAVHARHCFLSSKRLRPLLHAGKLSTGTF